MNSRSTFVVLIHIFRVFFPQIWPILLKKIVKIVINSVIGFIFKDKEGLLNGLFRVFWITYMQKVSNSTLFHQKQLLFSFFKTSLFIIARSRALKIVDTIFSIPKTWAVLLSLP